MKAIFVDKPSKVSVRDVSYPEVKKGEVLVVMKSCGVCGSDLEKIYGKYSKPSTRLGHEPSGVVVKTGEGVSELKQGDRVFVHHHVPCYSCHLCKQGSETMCPKYSETNVDPCGLAEQFIVPEWNVKHGGVLKIPESVSFEEAAMIEPLACCIRSWKKGGIIKRQDSSYTVTATSVGIVGVGPAGIMHVLLSRFYGIQRVVCTDINNYRLDFAKKLGATLAARSDDPGLEESVKSATSGIGVDTVIVATGNPKGIVQALSIVRNGGKVILFGVPSKETKIDLDLSAVYSKEISLIPSYAASEEDTRDALSLVKEKSVDVQGIITHKFSLEESAKALEYAHSGQDSMKIVINAY